MTLAPIVLFTFNRLDHTKKTIEALKQNILAKESELFIFSDGARNSDEEIKVELLRNYLKTIDGFKNVNIVEAQSNNGLAKSVIGGVTDIINKYNKVIVLEDDLITSKYFLAYMNECLEKFENRGDIWSISGYGPKIDIHNEYKDDIYLTRRASSWGWATWKDRWQLVEWEINDYYIFKKDKNMIREFNSSGKDLAPMLDDQIYGRIDSWAIRWVYSQFKNGMYTVYPVRSLVRNIGNDLSGTHTTNTTHFDVILSNKKILISEDVKENIQIINKFKCFYDNNFSGYCALILKKIGLYKSIKKVRKYILKYINL